MHLAERRVSNKPDRLLRLTVPRAMAHRIGDAPLRFVESGGHLEIIAPKNPLPQWAEALSTSQIAGWRIGRTEFSGRAVPMDEPNSSEVLVRFEAAFGPDRVRRWFGPSVQAFELRPNAVQNTEYREMVESYFDEIAPNYDQMVAVNGFDRELRRTSVEMLLRIFRSGDRVLELGCGTGLETLRLAAGGVRVLATDISSEMIRLLQRKIDSRGLSRLVEARQLAVRDLTVLLDENGAESFTGVFSTFGALNCEANLEALPHALATLLRPDGALVFGVWNRHCAAELALSLAAGNARRAFARHRTPVPVGWSRYGIPVYAHSFRAFVRPFVPYFSVEQVVGLPVFLPPYDYDRFFSRSKRVLEIMRRLDRRFAGQFPFNRFGDHFLVVMRRRR